MRIAISSTSLPSLAIPARRRFAWSTDRIRHIVPLRRVKGYQEGREGLGNDPLSLASAFAFALATDGILLFDGRKNIAKLLCKPFPESSWVLPRDFPYQNLQNHSILGPLEFEFAASLNSQHNLHGQDELISCKETYTALMGVKWVAWKSNQYFVTNFFLEPSFWQRLRLIFEDDIKYSFTYISRLGVHVRLHGRLNMAEYDRGAYDNVLNCLVENGYMPSSTDVDKSKELSALYDRKMQTVSGDVRSNVDVVMLVAFLQGKYAETMKDHFGQLSTKGAKMGRVHSVSQLGLENKGMGDIHPLILRLRKDDLNASCVLAQLVEPCNHSPGKPRVSWGHRKAE
ncbi:hypothetical protein L7F22_006639 [Adiantum nelumboides]|nr:hypothetical protein [Adiantum nelumboides]